jgi:carbamate kinase
MIMKILVALGGNAILQHKEKGTAEEQFRNVREACAHLAEIMKDGHQIVVTHGNGPQVGDMLLKDEMARDTLPPMPLDVCVAESQGMIGYMIQQSMRGELRKVGIDSPVITVLTETLVDPDDPAFNRPTKPIGPFYTAMQAAQLREEKGWYMVNDSGRGYRRAVPSPTPRSIVQGDAIKKLVDLNAIVVAAGGGGIPVTMPDGNKGVEAVIDKDLGASVLASVVGAEILLILTDVEKVFLNYGKPGQRPIDRMTVQECRDFLAAGQFPAGSMGPKIESAVRFLESGGRRVLITSLETAVETVAGRAGTTIVP